MGTLPRLVLYLALPTHDSIVEFSPGNIGACPAEIQARMASVHDLSKGRTSSTKTPRMMEYILTIMYSKIKIKFVLLTLISTKENTK